MFGNTTVHDPSESGGGGGGERAAPAVEDGGGGRVRQYIGLSEPMIGGGGLGAGGVGNGGCENCGIGGAIGRDGYGAFEPFVGSVGTLSSLCGNKVPSTMNMIPLDALLAESTIVPCTFDSVANVDDVGDDDDGIDGLISSSNNRLRPCSPTKSKSSSESTASLSARLSSEASTGPIDSLPREDPLFTPNRVSADFIRISV
jgi:hypothetical protein